MKELSLFDTSVDLSSVSEWAKSVNVEMPNAA
jgi:hypothetical protein